MRFKDVFSIIGPAMIGPSSSHTAGAVRLGRVARHLLGSRPERAELTLYGSFAETYLGHGTDVAMVGGLLDYDTDDLRIAQAMNHAAASGMSLELTRGTDPIPHPNTARIRCSSSGRSVEILGMSIGGGNIEIAQVDGFHVRFTALYFTLVLWHSDRQGLIADVTGLLNSGNVNIGSMETGRRARGGEALTVMETDVSADPSFLSRIAGLPGVRELRVVNLNLTDKSGG